MNADIARTTAPHPGPPRPTAPTRLFTIRLSATPRGARLARRLAAERLHSWGWTYDTEANHDATLLVSELATNATR
ncbi:ATP-binding protein, partial [Streptomyces sp. TRM76130]|nr:ATP-binding protein [Streptomyces sp. TRM76130]